MPNPPAEPLAGARCTRLRHGRQQNAFSPPFLASTPSSDQISQFCITTPTREVRETLNYAGEKPENGPEKTREETAFRLRQKSSLLSEGVVW